MISVSSLVVLAAAADCSTLSARYSSSSISIAARFPFSLCFCRRHFTTSTKLLFATRIACAFRFITSPPPLPMPSLSPLPPPPQLIGGRRQKQPTTICSTSPPPLSILFYSIPLGLGCATYVRLLTAAYALHCDAVDTQSRRRKKENSSCFIAPIKGCAYVNNNNNNNNAKM